MRNFPVRFLGAACAALVAAACGTVSVRVPVMRPAEVNMGPYQSLGVGEFKRRGNYEGGTTALQGSLEEALLTSGRFQVVDRQSLDKILRELQLSASDLSDPNNASKLGKLVTANAIIYGDVENTYRESMSDERNQDEKTKKVTTTYKLKGEAHVRATFRVVDVSTGRLIVSKTYEERRDDTNRAVDKRPEAIDKDGLFDSARRSVLDRFLKAIVPHQEYVYAHFEKDGDIPQLEGGIGWAERGDWSKAQSSFQTTIADCEKNPKIGSKALAKGYWNLGLSYEYAGDYDKAQKMVEKAYELSQEKDYLGEIDNIKRLQADAKKLAEQTATGPVSGR